MELFGIALENIIIGIVCGGMVGLFSWVKKRIEEYRIERKFPLSGYYISKFEDERDGQIETITAPVEIRQKGRKIMGCTYVLNEHRKWILEGEISSGGHIYGVYYAEDPHDKGIGNFFLYINHNLFMEGLWSGFDSINRKITSGRYTFTPQIEGLQICDLDPAELPVIAEIADSTLGKDYLDEHVKETLGDENTTFRVARAKDGSILGFCYSYSASPQQVIEKTGIQPLPKAIEYSLRIGVLKTIAVRPDIKARGVGTALIADTLSKMKEQQIQSVITIAWKNRKDIPIEGLMSCHGFKLVREIPEYWKEESIKKQYLCPDCGTPPCSCSAIIYIKTLG